MAVSFLVSLCAPATGHAQPVEDPGLSEPPPAPKPPPPPPPPPPQRQPPSGGRLEPHQWAPTVTAAPPPEVKETVDTKITWEKGTGSAAPVEGDLYERVVSSTTTGPVGLLHTITGESGRTNTFRIGLHLGGFQQDNFLIAGSGALKGDTNGRFTGDLTINYTPWKYIELYLALFNTSNQNTRTDPGRTDPEVILALGDLALGAKGRYGVTPYMDLALHFGVKFLNSVSGVLFDGDSTNVAIDAIASWDLRHATATKSVPLRFHINFGFLYDNSLALLPKGQCALSTGNDPCIRSRVVETFAYGIGTNRLRLALAVDAPVTIKSFGLQPFIEYHLDASVGDGDSTVKKALASSVSSDRLTSPTAQWLTIGLRLRPVAGLVLDAGIDVGLASPGFQYGPPVPQWNLLAGATYAYDGSVGQVPKTKVVTKTITREISRGGALGKLRGIVRDATTKKPISGAVVRYLNKRETPQYTADDGTFVSYGFAPGRVELEVAREDYLPTPSQGTVFAHGETPIEILLVAKPPQAGQLRTRVTNPEGQPIMNATVRLTEISHGSIIDADVEGPGVFNAKLPHGEYTMDTVAEGYLAKQRLVAISPGQVQTVDVVLTKKPTASHVSLGKGEIVVKGVIHFGTNNAEIRPDGQQLLDEVVDILIRSPQIKRVRIEGHTDNRGNADKNLQLSKERAAAVMAYLIKCGIDPARLTAEGYGASQPLVPNLTPANRAKNRRVAFKILDGGGIPLE